MIERILSKPIGFLVNVMVFLFSVTCVFPIIWIIYSSLKTQQEFSLNIISLPKVLQFNNYIEAFKVGKMQIYFFNSIFNSVIAVSCIMFIAFITAYALARYKFKGRDLIYSMFMVGMLIPIQSLLVPVFVEFKTFGLLDNRITLLLPYIAFGLPMAIFLIESFIKTIPIEMEEAAYIDGSSTTTTLFKIIFPLCKPVISTTIILTFLSTWNEFSFALVLLRSTKFKTLPVGLTNFTSQYSVNYPQLMAAMVITVLPVIVGYLIFNKKVIQGMTAGAVKG